MTGPAFREARERVRPDYEFRKALMGARLAAGVTQRQLAEKMGTTQSTLVSPEGGARAPTLEMLYRLADILNIDFTIVPGQPIVVRSHRAA